LVLRFSPPANSRQATLHGAVPCKAAFGPALQHVVTPSWHAPRDDPDHGAASPKAVRQRTLFSCRERKYISSQLQWIASKYGNGTGKIKKIVVSKWGSGSTKCLLLNGLDDFVLNKICSCFASLSEGEISIQCGAELQSMMKM